MGTREGKEHQELLVQREKLEQGDQKEQLELLESLTKMRSREYRKSWASGRERAKRRTGGGWKSWKRVER